VTVLARQFLTEAQFTQFLSYSGGGGAFPFSFSGDGGPISAAAELAFCGEQGEWHYEP
jgi:hypothetical protein